MERYFIDKKNKAKEMKIPKKLKNKELLFADGYDYALTNNKTLNHINDPAGVCWIQVELSDEQMKSATWEDFNKIINVKEKHKQLLAEKEQFYDKKNEPPRKEMTQADWDKHERELIELGRYDESQELLYDLGYGAITEGEYDLKMEELKNKWKAEDKTGFSQEKTDSQLYKYTELVNKACQDMYANIYEKILAKTSNPTAVEKASASETAREHVYYFYKDDIRAAERNKIAAFTMFEEFAEGDWLKHLQDAKLKEAKAFNEAHSGLSVELSNFRNYRISSSWEYDKLKDDKDFQDFLSQGGTLSGVFDISDNRTRKFVEKHAKYIYYGDVYSRDDSNQLKPVFDKKIDDNQKSADFSDGATNLAWLKNKLEYLKNPIEWHSEMDEVSDKEVKSEIASTKKTIREGNFVNDLAGQYETSTGRRVGDEINNLGAWDSIRPSNSKKKAAKSSSNDAFQEQE